MIRGMRTSPFALVLLFVVVADIYDCFAALPKKQEEIHSGCSASCLHIRYEDEFDFGDESHGHAGPDGQ